jgi:hypothetical protein
MGKDGTEKADDATVSTTGVLSDTRSIPSDTESVASNASAASQEMHAPIPERLADFFCVIGADVKIPENADVKITTPSDLQFQATLIDCVPKTRDDIEVPEQLSMFCFPEGMQLTSKPRESFVHSFVLTGGTGHRLYISTATLHEPFEVENLCELFWDKGLGLPSWLSDSEESFFLPKTIAVVSHHPFYATQTRFLHELLRIQNSESSLPLERYIANFMYDIPLPQPGGAIIRWNCFSKNDYNIEMARSPSNKLPLVNFSYQPLFRTLSITNILVLWGVLLQEGRVVLRSRHLSLLTPIVEALLSLLFPFTWQGMYIPLLPSNMLDALDAPVPFLVGVNGHCPHPVGVVVCDLDEDIVHLGYHDYHEERSMPILPRTLVLKLKSEIAEVTDPLYLIPACGLKGRITTGEGENLLQKSRREIYGHMSVLKEGSNKNLRDMIFSQAGLVKMAGAAGENIMVDPDQPIYKNQSKKKDDDSEEPKKPIRVVGLSFAGMERQREKVAASLYDINVDLEHAVRSSFLGFFTSLLKDYKQHNGKRSFRNEEFLGIFPDNSKECVKNLIDTQMFDCFLHESSSRRKLLDYYILLHNNDSLRLAEEEKRKYENVRKEVIIPVPPCQHGVISGRTFIYKTFPRLIEDELVANCNIVVDNNVDCCSSFFCQ